MNNKTKQNHNYNILLVEFKNNNQNRINYRAQRKKERKKEREKERKK
jgi:hypothetical protein